MKTVEFKVKLTFADDVEQKDLAEIMENVNNGIVHEAMEGDGITPEGTPLSCYLKSTEVSHETLSKSAKIEL